MSGQIAENSQRPAVMAASDKMLKRGLPALIVGGALLIAVVWWFTLHLAGVLAVHHVEQKMADVANKARQVLQSDASMTEKQRALALLAQFRDVQRIELRDATGRLIWRNYKSVSQVRPQLPAVGRTLLERRNIDGMQRTVARHLMELDAGVSKLRLILQAEVDGLLARYSAVARTVAKALTTVLLAAIFLMGYMLILRWREQRMLARQLRELLADMGAREDQLREAVAQMSGSNAQLLRRMLALGGAKEAGGEEAADMPGEQPRKRA